MTKWETEGLQLPDEAEYPSGLLEKYELLECFSSSPDSETLLARERNGGEKVTVKCFRKDHPIYGQSEPEPLRRLDAPPLPRFLGEYLNEHMRCVVRQYIPGESLASIKSVWTEQQTAEAGIRLCEQLQILHGAQQPIIHRDIKPENIILREDGMPVLIDFGIARVRCGKKTDTMIMGTQGYAPPEQYGFAETDQRSDIYSLGMVLNRLIRGQDELPEKAKTPLEKVILKMTAFDPDKRYDNVLQVKAALEKTGRRGRKPLIPAAAGIVLAAALAACGFLLLRSGPQPVSFSNPLIREAVRLNLGLPGEGAVTKEMLKQVSAVYIVANQACANENEFYAAIEAWYAGGKAERGNIRDLNDLSGMPQLKQVCIAAQELEDISALADMPQLTKVEMKHNKIGEISVLAGREHLTSVGFNDNPITDISPLAQCPGLRYLDLCDAHHYDPEVISELGDFVYLDLSNRTESFRYLAGKEIKRLRLAWTKLKNPEDLAGITGLEDLDIAHTQVSDLSPLSCHEELRRLNIAGSPVQDLTPLLLFPKLESVVLSRDMEHLADALKDPPFEILYE